MEHVNVAVAKETYELMTGLGRFIEAFKTALDDGWQPTRDIPEIIVAAVKDLYPAVQGVSEIAVEYQEDLDSVYRAAAVGLVDVILSIIAEG